MKNSLRIVCLLSMGVGSLLVGCDKGGVVDESPVANADFAIEVPITCPPPDGIDAGEGFYCNWVRIKGERSRDADAKYPCDSTVDVCVHFDSADGKIYSSDVPELRNLCPSTNNPHGTWSFSFDIYDTAECAGAPMRNLECPLIEDEYLVPGINKVNDVMCWTHNAEKDFDFDICVFDMTCEVECYRDRDCPQGWTCDKPTLPTVDALTKGVCRPVCDDPLVDCGYDATCVDDCDGMYCRKVCISGCRTDLDCVVERDGDPSTWEPTAYCQLDPTKPDFQHCVDP